MNDAQKQARESFWSMKMIFMMPSPTARRYPCLNVRWLGYVFDYLYLSRTENRTRILVRWP